MAVRKLIEGLWKGKPYNMAALLQQVSAISSTHKHLAICASPTGANWLGIRNATVQLFHEACIELPQHYSQQLLEEKDLQLFAETVRTANFKNVVFSGFPPYFGKLVNYLQGSTAQLSVILHGTFSEAGAGGKISEAMVAPLALLQQGKISKLAAVRKDVADFMGQHWQCKAFTLHNKCLVPAGVQPSIAREEGKHIGVFGTENFNKNLHNQVSAAVTIPKCRVFVSQPQLYAYLNASSIAGVPRSNHAEFLRTLASMDVNLHLSFSESWGQIAAESMALGVPCLVSPNTNLLDNDPGLKQALTVERIDSPLHIAKKIEEVLSDQQQLAERCRNYMDAINAEADILMAKFLAG